MVLDGEVATFDEHLVSRFHLLGDADPAVLCTPPMFIAFDVLQLGRQDVRALPLSRRRSIMEEAIADSEMVLPICRLEPHGGTAWNTVERRGLRGSWQRTQQRLPLRPDALVGQGQGPA